MRGSESSPHVSHSQRETLERCAKSWFLKYETAAPRRPALWTAGGSAVHEVTEAYDRWTEDRPFDVQSFWDMHFGHHLDRLRQADPNENNWNRSPSEPIEIWNQIGPAFVQSWTDWRSKSPYEIWTTPDGQPAIELDVSGYLPGCPVEIKGYVDRIFRDPILDTLVIVDLKTGKRPPKGPAQFAVYAALVEVKYGVKCAIGAPFMNRKGTLGKAYPLAEHTPEAVGAVFGETWKRIQAGDFPADGFPKACWVCDVAASCAANNGPLAYLYDPDAKIPF